MIRFITPVILIGIAIASFFMLTDPLYQEVQAKRAEVDSYDEALNNSKALENERDRLTQELNDIDKENLVKIKKLLPDNIDNIRLILEIGQVGAPYGMTLRNVKYSSLKDNARPITADTIQGGGIETAGQKDYGVWDLEFSTEGTYNNFINFLHDLESNLRIVDISSITFSSDVNLGLNSASDIYSYNFKIKTYWLKN